MNKDGSLYVQGLSDIPVKSYSDVNTQLEIANKNRSTV